MSLSDIPRKSSKVFWENALKSIKSSPGDINKKSDLNKKRKLSFGDLMNTNKPKSSFNLISNAKRRQSSASIEGYKLTVPNQGGKAAANQTSRRSSAASGISRGSAGSSGGGSHDGSEEGGNNAPRRRRKNKSGDKNKKENIFTHIRDRIAESDVFVERNYSPPHKTCIYITILIIPVVLLLLIWDTLAVSAFEIPHVSMIDHPGFVVVFQFMFILMAMYGCSIQLVIRDKDKMAHLSKISLACHYLLFIWRVFLEMYYDGYRYQLKSYLPTAT